MSLYADDSLTALQEIGNNYSSMKQLHTWKTTPQPPTPPIPPQVTNDFFLHYHYPPWLTSMERSCVWPRVLVVSHWAAWVELRRGQRQLPQSSVGQRSQDFCPRHCLCCKSYLLAVVWRDNSVCVHRCVKRGWRQRARERVCFWKFLRFSPRTAGLWLHIGIIISSSEYALVSRASRLPCSLTGRKHPHLIQKPKAFFFFHFILYVVSLNLHFK